MNSHDSAPTGSTPSQEAEAEHYQDTEGLSPYDARAKARGYYDDQSMETQSEKVGAYHLPGKPLHFPPSGHVYDYTGRADEYRGGDMAIPQTEVSHEAVTTTAKFLKRRHIQHDYLDGELTYNRACAMYLDIFGDEAPDLILTDLGDGSFYRSSIKRIE